MPWFKLTIAYDGTDFAGWQAQRDQRTVQGELERAWREITGESVRVTASGRTDAGVHAIGQVVGVESATRIEPDGLVRALNAMLPEDVAVRAVEVAPEGFHATTDAKRKIYQYTFCNDRRRPVFARRYAWHVPTPLNFEAMDRAAQFLVGTHDFVCFQSAGSERESTVRTIFCAHMNQDPVGFFTPPAFARPPRVAPDHLESGGIYCFEIEGDGFLYTMVRTIAGTLVEVGRGKRDPEWVAEVIASRDRKQAGQTAPPQGLALAWVGY